MTNHGETLHPGRILLTQAMEPLGISRNQLARDIDVPVGRISDITNGKRGVTADTALRLGRYFGTGPELWLRLQAEYDLHVARMTTWPAVESRVRVLSDQAPDEVPAEVPAPAAAETPAAAPKESAAEEPPVVEENPIDDEISGEMVSQTPKDEEHVVSEEPQSSRESEPEADAHPDFDNLPGSENLTAAEIFQRAGFQMELETTPEQLEDQETSTETPQSDSGAQSTDDLESEPDDNPDPFADRDAELGIPPIPDPSKLYQSG